MKHLTVWQVRDLCIKKDWFTGGSCEAYEKMFGMVESDDFTIRDVAIAIYICSPDSELKDIIEELSYIAICNLTDEQL